MRVKDPKNGLSVTRRGFLAGLAGAGASVALYGCAGKGSPVTYATPGAMAAGSSIPYNSSEFVYGTSAHNCGGRCIIRGQVENGKIVRFVTDENESGKGFVNGQTVSGKIDPESPNNTQARACSRCRSYRFRLYHAGRLKYPMKQTKKRGDLSGFVRISWDQALREIAQKHKATFDKYGPDAMYCNYASAAGGSQGSAAIWRPVLDILGGHVNYWGSYSTHQWRYCVNGYSGFPQQVNSTGQGYSTDYTGNSYHGNCNDIGQDTKNVVMWGSNYMTTYHQYAYATLRALENMKARYKNDPSGGNAIFVGPAFVDQGVTVATEWLQIKPYTDPAMMLAMMYEMIVNTFNPDGSLKPENERWLDVDYLDTMVYGFFDSPEYWIDQETGEIFLKKPTNKQQYWVPLTRTGGMTGFKNVKVDWSQRVYGAARPAIPAIPKDTSQPYVFDWIEGIRRVDAVPAGRSLSAYIMGDDDRLTKAKYSASKNYVAQAFKASSRNGSVCSYNIKGKKASKSTKTDYQTKADFLTPKTSAWAEAITGVKKEDIIRMARFYADKNNHPIYSEWCGGLQKQANGVNNLVMLQMFLVVAKCWGEPGNGWGRGIESASTGIRGSDAIANPSFTGLPKHPETPIPSCTAWHNAIKVAYTADLKKNGYTAKYVPDYKEIGKPYMDDGGTKALVTWSRDNNGNVEMLPPDKDGNIFYKWKGSKAQYSGFRFIVNAGGNILVNQHECSNDLVDMWEKIPLSDTGPDSLCIVTLDNFMSPTPRWSDYVLPAATTWEQPTVIKPFHGSNMYIPTVTKAPGESKTQFDSGLEFLKAYEKISGKTGLAKTYTWGKDGMTVEEKVKESFDRISKSETSPFFGKTWDEFVANPYVPAIPNETTKKMTNPKTAKLRADLEAYLAGPMDKPFTDSIDNKGVYIVTYHSAEGVESPCQGSYGNEYPRYTLPSKTLPEASKGAPSPSGRFHVYSGLYVWQYEWKFSKWHGHLPADQRGQKNKDMEGDPIVYPIPMYYAYEDYFMEAYGGKVDQIFKKYDSHGPLLMTTTHNRFRSHSTFAEVGYLRELTHRTVKGTTSNTDGVHNVVDGGIYSGNDWGEYGMSTPLSGDMRENWGGDIPRLNKPIQYNQDNATYSEFWINVEDAKERGIEDGDLLLVQNPVGAVRVVARVTHRSAKGFCDLHQGCWFDPGPDGVDDGGNCNTLMAQKHSSIDHGNGQQSAMVSVTKVR